MVSQCVRWTFYVFFVSSCAPFIFSAPSSSQVLKKGFIVPFCTDLTSLVSGSGHIVSPKFQDGGPYPAPMFLCWRIQVQQGYSIAFEFGHLDVGTIIAGQGCRDGWVKLYDGPSDQSPVIGQYCGSQILPGQVMSTGTTMYVEIYVTTNSNNQRGFNAQYFAVRTVTTTTTSGPPVPGCDGEPLVLTSDSGVVTSPGYGDGQFYRTNRFCEWVLLGEPGEVFKISFSNFMLEQSPTCEYDYFSISDAMDVSEESLTSDLSTCTVNSTLSNVTWTTNTSAWNESRSNTIFNKTSTLLNVCGYHLPYDVETNSHIAVLTFHSDGQVGGKGFNLTFIKTKPTLKCGEEEFRCGNNEKCINWTQVCDNTNHCRDGSDELVCPSSGSCGLPAILPIGSRVVGGSEAPRGAWPWTVSILDSHNQAHRCGATLVLPQWVLSAAHCFTREYNRDYTGYSVRAGRHNLHIADRHEQTVRIAEVFSRRDFVQQWSVNDIALVRLKDPFVMTDYVRTVCLPSSPVETGSQCYLAGWGETLNTCCANSLKQALLPVINSTVCAGADFYGSRFREHMFCAGYVDGGVDACGVALLHCFLCHAMFLRLLRSCWFSGDDCADIP
ncbi:ovochymase-1 [Elysia marginata]|uniref:Ovochymase-1 n=1 Tax=Elysia marginata TaxID=1093978 RepID=A0AAV4FNZ2_9GAST|nr:ovochymase-1 [Elysia marginata]